MQEKLFVADETHGLHGLSGLPNPAGETAEEKITARQLRNLLEQQRYRCAITGRELTPQTASIDHREPLARGGPHAASNLQIVHCDVNAAKNTMTQDEFIAMCREVARFHDGAASD